MQFERRKESLLAILAICLMISVLVGLAIVKGHDGVIFASGVGGLTFCAGLVLPNPFRRKPKDHHDDGV